MPEYQIKTNIIRTEHLSSDMVRLTLDAPDIASAAKPGQFVMVRVDDQCDPLLRRPFSIYQATADGRLQILFKVLGKGTRLLAATRTGQRLNLVGPLGKGFNLSAGRGKRVCLIGGGMGAAPLFFLAQEFMRVFDPEKLLVLLGARNAQELHAVATDFEALGVELLMATDDGSAAHHGLVIDLIDGTMGGSSDWAVYSCGPHPMLRAVAAICLERGWPCQVSLETMMACGISACLGCAIPRAEGTGEGYLHVCKDGPVFAAGDVLWR